MSLKTYKQVYRQKYQILIYLTLIKNWLLD